MCSPVTRSTFGNSIVECASACVLGASGKIVREDKVASEPQALLAWFGALNVSVTRIELELLELHRQRLLEMGQRLLIRTHRRQQEAQVVQVAGKVGVAVWVF